MAYEYYRHRNKEYTLLGYAPKDCLTNSCELNYLRATHPLTRVVLDKLATKEDVKTIDDHCLNCTKKTMFGK